MHECKFNCGTAVCLGFLLRGCATRRKLSLTELIFLAERVLYRYCCCFKSFCSCVFHVFCFGFCFTCETELLLLLFFVRAQIIFSVPSAPLRQEFGKRILRRTGFLFGNGVL